MNLKYPRTRRGAIAFASAAAVVVGGVGVAASNAFATSELTLSANTSTSPTILNLGTQTGDIDTQGDNLDMDQEVANATYAARVTSSTTTLKLSLDSAPTGASKLYYGTAAASGAAAPATDGWANYLTTGGTALSGALTAGNYQYLTADVPGAYAVHFVDTLGTVDASDDVLSPTINITVLDMNGSTGATSDDWAPVITAPTTSVIGAPVAVSSSLAPLTLQDARGTSGTANYLASAVAGLTGLRITGGGNVEATASAATLSGSSVTRTIATDAITAGGAITSYTYFDINGDGDWTIGAADGVQVGSTATTTAATNNVATMSVAVPAVAGTVAANTASTDTAYVKTGTSTVAVTATVDTLGAGTDKSGKVMYFTLGGGDVASLTTDGTTVNNTTHIFSAVTNASGVATLRITDSAASPASYTVKATSNHVYGATLLTAAGAGTVVTVSYAAATPTTVEVTNTGTSLYPTTGSSVTLTGRLVDQFATVIQPSAGAVQAQVFFGGADNTAPTLTNGVTALSGAAANVVISAGAFSYTYTPGTAPAAGYRTVFAFVYDKNNNGTFNTGESVLGTISWGSTAAAATATITTPANAAALNPTVQVATTSPAGAGTQIQGAITDSGNTALPYKAVTLTGSGGVYFSDNANPDADHPLSTSLTVSTDNSGVYTAYAFFTRVGTPTVTVTSGAATTSLTAAAAMSAAANTSGYIVTVDDVSGRPGDVLTVAGTVTDAFGNPITTGTPVTLSLDGSALGSLANTTPTMDAAGHFSTTIQTGSNADGEVTVTGTIAIAGGATTPAAAWGTAGLVIANPVATDTAVASVEPDSVTLSVSPATRVGAGSVTVSGTARANASVDVYAKAAGTSNTLGWIGTATANASGNWSKAFTISSSTTFVARSGSATSGEATATVTRLVVQRSTVSLRGTALGSGRVRLVANGGQRLGTTKFYQKVGTRWVLKATVRANASGDASYTVRTTRGVKSFKAVYTAPGRTAATASVTVRVR